MCNSGQDGERVDRNGQRRCDGVAKRRAAALESKQQLGRSVAVSPLAGGGRLERAVGWTGCEIRASSDIRWVEARVAGAAQPW